METREDAQILCEYPKNPSPKLGQEEGEAAQLEQHHGGGGEADTQKRVRSVISEFSFQQARDEPQNCY